MASILSACLLISSFILSAKAQEGARRWDEWSRWTECSRTCGVGISRQTRNCLYRVDGKLACEGESTKYRTCNFQDCPEGVKDFRSEQCAIFNNRLFRGQSYQWVPYIPGQAKCSLHCMPKSRGFYVNWAPQVIDGTRCGKNPYEICVNGTCKSMGCDLNFGSSAKEDNCRVCNGNNRNCVTHKGHYDKTGDGYKEFLVLPTGSMNIRIQEIGYSEHFLAMTDAAGKYIFNGDYRIISSKEIENAGTTVEYKRVTRGPEKIFIKGPLTKPLHAVILLRDSRLPNPGVIYEFSVPSSVTTLPQSANHSWRTGGYGTCSATCAGGQQKRPIGCVRDRDNIRVDEEYCNAATKPETMRKCNTQPCPARWHTARWSRCSRTCAEGKQVRRVQCMHIINGRQTVGLPDNRCPGPKPSGMRSCQNIPRCPVWFIGQWSACSVTCGVGARRRVVSCVAEVTDNSVGDPHTLPDSSCNQATKSRTTEQCNRGPCTVKWLASDWSECYPRCGNGLSTRMVYCVSVTDASQKYSEELCDARTRPQDNKQCQSNEVCPPMWFGSQWSACSATCGSGMQMRKVMCVMRAGPKTLSELADDRCNITQRLAESRKCSVRPCSAKWCIHPWRQCSRTCGEGVQSRDVKCIADSKEDATERWCDKSSKPLSQKRCFLGECRAIVTKPPTRKPTTKSATIAITTIPATTPIVETTGTPTTIPSSTATTPIVETTGKPTTIPPSTATPTTDPSSQYTPARIVQGPRNVVNLVGRDVIFRCRADGFPAPSITWRKEREPIRQSSKHQIYRDGTLRITSIALSDTAKYVCIASNGVGRAVTSYADLTVVDPPRVRISEDTTVFEGATVYIRCGITGTPRPIANWYKDNSLLYLGKSRGTVTRTLVTITKARSTDGGTYECRAVHDNGSDKASMTLTVVKPATPTPPEKCEDDGNVARCSLVKTVGFCRHPYYKRACCLTCKT